MHKLVKYYFAPSWLSQALLPTLLTAALPLLLSSCSQFAPLTRIDATFLTPEDVQKHTLSSASIRLNASSPALNIKQGLVITDNDQAFTEKIKLIHEAKHTIDLAYYIYKDDYSSSVLSQALIDAARRGIRVRLLLDYQSTYADLDLFSMLERYGNKSNKSGGSLEIRFYNRPTVNIIKDAMYLTLDCSDVQQENGSRACSPAKYKTIESRFSLQATNTTSDLAALNLNSGGSGLFLSAFYANNISLMALAIREGQNFEEFFPKTDTTTDKRLNPNDIDKLISLAKIYVTARHGKGLQKFAAGLKLKLAFALFGGEINPYYDAFTNYFPIGRERPRRASLQDWNYVKDFYHQKLLLVDSTQLQLGGRNIEDAYHMHPNPLTEHYVFLDTDVLLKLQTRENSLQQSFDRLWNFRQMVATIDDIRLHAPNDFLMATIQSKKGCEQLSDAKKQHCEMQLFKHYYDQEHRIHNTYNKLQKNRKTYDKQYVEKKEHHRPHFRIDPGAEVYYVENLPFNHASTQQHSRQLFRQYGAENGKEGRSGKYIHNLWLAALRNTCKQATAENPQEIIMHNAYVFFPSNLLRQLAEMLTGVQDCRHVSITILTNSIDTTDLGIENYAARYSMKAFHHYVTIQKEKQPGATKKAAKFAYYEYKAPAIKSSAIRSLHSKVMLFGTELFIGSANADVRSYMMDANNGLHIRQAPKLISEYKQWFHSILDDQQRSTNITEYYAQQSLEEMLASDLPKLESMLLSFSNKLPGESTLNPALKAQLGKQLKTALEAIYRLSVQSLGNGRESYEAGEQFNEWFKMI